MIKYLARMFGLTKPQQPRYSRSIFTDTAGAMFGADITDERAMRLAAYWACVRVIAGSLAQVPWRIMATEANGDREPAENHPAFGLLKYGPNSEMDAAVWKELQIRWLLTWGNAYNEIERDASNRVSAFWPIEPWRVTIERDGMGGLVYVVKNDMADDSRLPAADVLHFKGLGDGLMGHSVLTYGANAIGLGLTQEQSMSSQMRNGSRISGIMSQKSGASIKPENLKALKQQFDEEMAGAGKHGRVLWTNAGFEFEGLAMPNTDVQLLESRQFSVLEICRFTGCPPHLAYELTRATFSNIEQQSLEFVMYTLAPWASKIENQISRKVISLANRRRYECKIFLQGLARGAMKERTEGYWQLWQMGAMSTNDIRRLEDMNAVTGGDVRYVPQNMGILGEPPEPPAPPDPTPEQSNGRVASVRRD